MACLTLGAADASPARIPDRSVPGAIRASLTQRPHHHHGRCHSPGSGVVVGGRCRWTTVLHYYVIPNAILGRLTLRGAHRYAGRISVYRAGRHGRRGPPVAQRRARSRVALDVLDALPSRGGEVVLVITGSSPRRTTRFTYVSLRVRSQEPFTIVPIQGGADTPSPGASDGVAGDTPPGQPGQVVAAPPTNGSAVWVSRSELLSRPVSGRQWSDLLAAADSAFGRAKISSQDSNHDVLTLAAALVWARTGIASYRAKAADAINRAIGTEAGGRTLALGRNLAGYVVAADLIDLKTYNPTVDQRFRPWLSKVRTENLGGLTLISTHETRSNNWGAMAGVSRIAADLYLGDVSDLNRAATVFEGYTGDRSAYAGFEFGDRSWQADPSASVPIDPPGASKAGLSIDGALPDDMRRGCAFQVPPCRTTYPWEAMQGIIMQADLLSHHGFPAFAWSDNAVYRAARFLRNLDALYGGWWVTGDDVWQPSVLNHAYGPVFPSNGAGAGKVFGWTDWVYGT
ncbi:MAG: hypothetical protein ACXVSX_03235 [Solirubrobacteraceae bacterium]